MTSPQHSDRPPRLLCIGDVHLGRRPTRIPDGLDPRALGPAAAFDAACREALARDVDAVLLAGDVVENDEEFLEAYPPLLTGARALAQGGIALLAVVGNHDTKVLPRLARDVPGVRLVGAGGRWGTALVERAGRSVARVVGWSFPVPRVTTSPLADYPSDWYEHRFADGAPEGLPTLGLLHCDLDAGGGYHAPVRRSELVRTGLAFALGHIHRPSDLSGTRPIGYLGSLSGLDPGEPGRRGPWLFEATPEGWRAEPIPLARLRYDVATVDVDGASDADALESRAEAALAALVDRLDADGDPARALAARVVFTGERALPAAAVAALATRLVELGARTFGRRAVFVEHGIDRSRAPLDLAALARNDDPPGLLASRLLALESGSPSRADLLARARTSMARRLERFPPGVPRPDVGTDEALAELLVREGRLALEELLETGGKAP